MLDWVLNTSEWVVILVTRNYSIQYRMSRKLAMAMTDKLKFATLGFFEYSRTEGKERAGVLLHFEQ